MKYRLGKKPARPYALKLGDYLDHGALPPIPDNFGHDGLISDWGMLGNDRVGDCYFAGAAHETLVWNAEANKIVEFDTPTVLSDYSAATGYNPADPMSDHGTDVQVGALYRMNTGLLDMDGVRHKVAGFAAVNARNIQQLRAAAYLFGAIGVGLALPDSAQQQHAAGQPWTVVEGAHVLGGHYVPMVGWRDGMAVMVTWGAEQMATPEFLSVYSDEAIVYLSQEMLTGGRTPEGFDVDQLVADLGRLEAMA